MKHIHYFLFKTDEDALKPDENDDSVTEAKWFHTDKAIKVSFAKEGKNFWREIEKSY